MDYPRLCLIAITLYVKSLNHFIYWKRKLHNYVNFKFLFKKENCLDKIKKSIINMITYHHKLLKYTYDLKLGSLDLGEVPLPLIQTLNLILTVFPMCVNT